MDHWDDDNSSGCDSPVKKLSTTSCNLCADRDVSCGAGGVENYDDGVVTVRKEVEVAVVGMLW